MTIKNLKTVSGIILAGFGLFIFIFSNFIYGHVKWINTSTFQLNIGLVTPLSIFVFSFGLLLILKNTTSVFNSSPRPLFLARKIFACVLLGNLLYVLFYAKLFGLFLWLMFFNVAFIFCLYLLFTRHNGYIAGFFFFFLGLAYALVPVFPGPTVWMTEFYANPAAALSEGGDKLLLLQIIAVKMIAAISGIFVLFAAFFKK
jgi:hypothetical protein